MIDTAEALKDLCGQMEASSCIAFDTEFIRGKSPQTILAVVQVGFSIEKTYLIDVLAFDDLRILKPILERSDIVKILHDAPQDLELLSAASGATPRNIFDVQLAARLLGVGTTYSLSELALQLVDVHLSKNQQRSNWLRRPLSGSQITYAKRDVAYLPQIRKLLLSESDRLGRGPWLEEEMSSFDDPSSFLPASPTERLLRSPATYSFTPWQCALVAEVAKWRSKTSLATDVLEKRLIKDTEILRLAKKKCTKPGAVRRVCPSLPPPYIPKITKLIAKARNQPSDSCPKSLAQRPLSKTELSQLLILQAVVAGTAAEYEIEPRLLGNNTILTDFLLDPEGPSNPLRRGWRWDVVGQSLFEILQGRASIRLDHDGLMVHRDPH